MNIENKQFFQDGKLMRIVPSERYEMKPDEQHYITKELTKVKLDDDIGEIWTYPALHLFHGRISEKIVKDVIEHCTNTNNDDAADKLVANIEGPQSYLDADHPLMKEFVEVMMRSACTFVDQCMMTNPSWEHAQPRRIEIQEIWDVKMKPGDYNPLHIHGTKAMQGLSSICYLKVPDGLHQAEEEGVMNPKYNYAAKIDGWLKFLWGIPDHYKFDEFACPTGTHILPKVGDYYIFPKSLNHEVYPFRDNEDRWSVQINFNCWEEGKDGNEY